MRIDKKEYHDAVYTGEANTKTGLVHIWSAFRGGSQAAKSEDATQGEFVLPRSLQSPDDGQRET